MTFKEFLEDIYIDVLVSILFIVYVLMNPINTGQYRFGVYLALVSFVLWLISRFQLGKSFTMKAEARELITHGIYSKVRHPMYLFSSLMILGILLCLNYIIGYVLFIILIYVQISRMKKEEKTLERKFGNKYIEYKSKSWF
ncbi:MAG: putative protein-S-isoprenylcysteine methyltransferase [Candidatus Nomurabacteria bacterium]|nr:putative protein-S-isoprenylcysteine methyltransferase [Candidatus Nomurabacteria bacterium]